MITLEGQFGEYGLLTEKQKNKLKKKVWKEYYGNKRRYTAQDVEDLFQGTSFPQEIISKELSTIVKNDKYFSKQNSKKENKKEDKIKIYKNKKHRSVKYKKDNKINNVLGAILACGFTFLCVGICTYQAIRTGEKYRKFNIEYNEKVIEYADRNSDGIITNSERIDLNLRILKNKKVTFSGDEYMGEGNVKYQNKESVLLDELTKWIEDYKE